MTAWRMTPTQRVRLDRHPSISGTFAAEKGLWEGRNVAVEFLRERGTYHRRTDMRILYGTLVLTPDPNRTDQIGVRAPDDTVHPIHVKRAKTIYDLTRVKTDQEARQ